jgi:hypothetical protein
MCKGMEVKQPELYLPIKKLANRRENVRERVRHFTLNVFTEQPESQ